TAGAGISHQMEMLLSMLESDIRRKLAEDLWGNDAAHNPGASNHEAYDGPDSDHAWLRGICGNLIDWEGNDSGHMQYVVQSDGSGWKTLAGTDAKNLQFRYAVLIQDLGGLVNVNVARRPDPDTMGNAYAVSPDVHDTENWPHSIWAFHALRSDEQWWGYWWYPFGTRGYGTSLGGGTEPIYSGMGVHFRGGGPATGANLEWLVQSAELKNIDRHFRNIKHYGRQFDIQDELDLRFPNSSSNGSLCESLLEQLAPSVFASQRRRLVTAIGRTTNWQRRREPIHMHPYGNQFWTDSLAHLPAAIRNPDWCMEWWRFKVDYPCFDDLVRYFQESRMGYRIPVVMGT
ncbi:MAG: hypothetical protein KAI25_02420, partial [Hyphomicrobiaceae bacterium]|nr:hypothetical protein [Hyphomicrobiaceae bacterium]